MSQFKRQPCRTDHQPLDETTEAGEVVTPRQWQRERRPSSETQAALRRRQVEARIQRELAIERYEATRERSWPARLLLGWWHAFCDWRR